jgi:hypothetical protein
MTELMRLYLEIKSKNPKLSDTIARQQASIYFFRKNLPFVLNAADKIYLDNLALSSSINGELNYVAPIPTKVDLSINSYVEDDYLDDYFE